MPIILELGNKTQIPAANFRKKFLFYLVTLNPIKKILNPDPLKALFKTLYFLFKCVFLPEVVNNYVFWLALSENATNALIGQERNSSLLIRSNLAIDLLN
jgi:hypothetical protein